MAAAGVVGTVGARSFHPPGRKLHISSSRKFFVAQNIQFHMILGHYFIHFRSRDHRNGVAQITVVWKFQQNLPRNLGKFQKRMIFECWGVGVCVQILKSATQKHTKIHFGRVNRRSSWAKTHRRRSGWRDLDQSGNSWEISKMCRKISDFMKISKTLRSVRFGAATTNDERGAGMGSARTIGPRAP
jgi:hypothetical protein